MKTLDPEFKRHLESGQTTLATCWTLTRRDGMVLGFTDHDEPIRFDGITFAPAHGLDGGESTSKLGPQVDTSEVMGVLHAQAITEDDIALGRYDGAQVQTWRVNWRDPGMRDLLRTDTIGEIVREDGVFRAELRSGQSALNTSRGRIYAALCDAELGDGRCAVGTTAAQFQAQAGVIKVRDPYRVAVTGLGGFAENWFGFGRARWTGGKRAGLTDRIGTHTRVGGVDVLSFDVAVGDWLSPGDGLSVTAGCDRRFSTCKAKFANSLNFRGFPHVPGSDFVLRYPRAGGRHNGQAIFK